VSVLQDLLRPRSVPPPVAEKAATGAGAVALTYEPKLFARENDPQAAAARGQSLGLGNLWIRASERAISSLFSTVKWELRTPDGEPVTDDSPEELRAVRELLRTPYRPVEGEPITASPRTGRGLGYITCRHMGLSGGGFWYLSGTELFAGTPSQIIYINPARMMPATNKQGALLGWVMDPGSRNPVGFKTDEIIYQPLEEPDNGHLATGLVESALTSADVTRLADRQAAGVLSSGGRLTGIVSPKEGVMPPTTYDQVIKDLRTITEMPDAAKRNLVLKGAVEFTPTSVSPSDLDLVALSEMGRDALLALWGVPLSQLGGATAAGLNGGERPKYDEATLWQKAVGPRLRIHQEVIQGQLLDRYKAFGIDLELVLHMPEFDDMAPAFEMAANAVTQPLTILERRSLLGYGSSGDPVFDAAIIYTPGERSAPVIRGLEGEPELEMIDPALEIAELATPETPDTLGKAKGIHALTDALSPKLQRALLPFLEAQRERVRVALLRNAEHVGKRPGDTDAWWDKAREDRELLAIFEEQLGPLASRVATATAGKASLTERVTASALSRLAARVTDINELTRSAIRDLMVFGVGQGASVTDLASVIRGGGLRELVAPLEGDSGAIVKGVERAFASELRAETIARTESMVTANTAALDTYGETGITMVRAIDGDKDDACRERDGEPFTLADADAETMAEHPNGTLAWQPITIAEG